MFYLGLDLGQTNDPSAIVIVQRFDAVDLHRVLKFHSLRVRHAQRIPLGTPYPKVVDHVRTILQHQELRNNCAIALDATGVGAPVVDMLKAARLGCDITPVKITPGDLQTRNGSTHNVPKRDLLACVQVLFDRGELKFAHDLVEMGALIRELTDFRSTTTSSGHTRLGADGHNEHDDLVIALALACWRARRRYNGFGTQRLV